MGLVLVALMAYLYATMIGGLGDMAPVALPLVGVLALVLGVGIGEWLTKR